MSVDITTARTIIKQAIKDETYGGAEPEDDATCIKEADQLVEMAEQAWAQYIRGPEVETILKLAAAMPNGDSPADDPREEPVSDGESDTTDEGLADEESETAPETNLEDLDPELTKVEPWEGYGEDRVKDITEGINIAMAEVDANPTDQSALISHIWAYEMAHKRRARVLKHVKEANDQLTGGSGGGTEETPATDSAQETERVRESGDEGVSQATEGTADESDAANEPKSDAGEPASEAGTEREKPSTKAPAESKGSGSNRGEAKPFGEDKNPAYRALIEGVERELEAERVHLPSPPSEPIPDLPFRWADISNSDLHDFHMQYAAAAYYKSYIVSRDDRIAIHCKNAADELHRELLNAATKIDEKGKPIPVTVLEAQVEGDPNVKSWRKRQRKHEAFAISAKRELDSYHKLVEALSRMESMRHQAWERGRKS